MRVGQPGWATPRAATCSESTPRAGADGPPRPLGDRAARGESAPAEDERRRDGRPAPPAARRGRNETQGSPGLYRPARIVSMKSTPVGAAPSACQARCRSLPAADVSDVGRHRVGRVAVTAPARRSRPSEDVGRGFVDPEVDAKSAARRYFGAIREQVRSFHAGAQAAPRRSAIARSSLRCSLHVDGRLAGCSRGVITRFRELVRGETRPSCAAGNAALGHSETRPI